MAANILYIVLFVFTWILAPIAAVNWCYVFKLSLPRYSETLAGWFIYTALILFSMPALKLILLSRGASPNSRTKEIGRMMLVSMTGTAVATSFSGLVALMFPHFSDLDRPGPSGFALAFTITILVVVLHTLLEMALERMQDSEGSYGGVLLNIVLNSLWSSLGFFWNAVWNRTFKNTTSPSTSRHLEDLVNEGRIIFQVGSDTEDRFKTIADEMNGRPSDISSDKGGPGYTVILVKAFVTLAIGMVGLWFVPEPPSEQGRILIRRLLISAKMMLIIIPSYAVTDAGYYFGTTYVANATGSSGVGLLVAFLYALVLTIGITYAASVVSWKPKSRIADRSLQLACWLVCYAWWYPWQELLYQIQGYGLSRLGLPLWLTVTLKFTFSIGTAALSTALFAGVFNRCLALRFTAAREQLTSITRAESARLAEEASQDNTLRFFTEIAGLQSDEVAAAGAGTSMQDTLATE